MSAFLRIGNQAVLAAFASIIGVASGSTVVTVPPGLNPGDHYRLVFITTDFTNATSTDIATYNSFVTTEAMSNPALAALNTVWSVIGSTETTDAIDNVGLDTGVPVYRLDGALVVTTSSLLFNQGSTSLSAAININQSGNTSTSPFAWTGSNWDGRKFNPAAQMAALGDTDPDVGVPTSTNKNYLSNMPALTDNTELHALYGISGVITVTPEPSSFLLLFIGGLLLARRWNRRH